MNERIHAIYSAHPYLEERPSSDWKAFNCPSDQLLSFLQALRDEHQFDLLADLTAIDHYDVNPRFEVVYHVYSTERHEYLRIATPCSGHEHPSCPSVVDLWPTANWHERETYDMFGIHFEGHPDLRRILMWDGYPHFPLRKEFPLAGKEVDLPSEDLAEVTGTKVKPAPMMGGPFHAPQTHSMARREPRADDESWTEISERPESSAGDKERPRELRSSDEQI
jgi:NADH-quinone oxidoreductase subunit C